MLSAARHRISYRRTVGEWPCLRSDIALEISGADTGVWQAGDPEGGLVGNRFLARQGSELGGGSTEIQRNIISERVLEMPREPAADRGVPFNQVRRNAMPTKQGS